MSDIVRWATPDDADALGEVHVTTWQSAYRGIFPDAFLDELDLEPVEAVEERADALARQQLAASHVLCTRRIAAALLPILALAASPHATATAGEPRGWHPKMGAARAFAATRRGEVAIAVRAPDRPWSFRGPVPARRAGGGGRGKAPARREGGRRSPPPGRR